MENKTPAPFERSKPVAQLLIFLGLTFIALCLLMIILTILQAAGIINLFRIQDPANYIDNAVVRDSRNIQMLQDLFVFIIPTIVISFLVSRNQLQYLQLNKIGKIPLLLMGAITIVASMPLISFLGELNQQIPLPGVLQHMEQEADAIETAFEMHHTHYDLILNIIVMALVAGIAEEFFFRAGMQTILIKMTRKPHVAIWITAAVFSAIHMQFSGFFPRMLLGGFLGYLFLWSGSIWVNIFAHCTFNGIQILVQYLQDAKATPGIVDKTFSDTPGYGYVIISTLLVAVFTVVIYRLSDRKSAFESEEVLT